MLTAKDIKQKLTLKDINKLMQYLDAGPKQHGKIIQSQTICHNGESHKLYYYDNNHTFHCYTNCGSFDVFELIQKFKDITFKKAFFWIKRFYSFNGRQQPSNDYSELEDPLVEFNRQLKAPKLETLTSYNPKILDDFDNIAYVDWVRQGITPDTLTKFKIKLSIPDEEIIIPEFDQNNRLIGIRCRHLDQQSLDQGKKYTPINYKGKELNYPTGQILYGLNFNQDAINRYHKIILFEGEKSVLKLDSQLHDKNIAVGLNGSNLTDQHIQILKNLDIKEVAIALDKEYKHSYTKSERIYAEQIESEFSRLKKYFNLSVIWDQHDLLDYKNSPIDKGYQIFKKLCKERILLDENTPNQN